MVVDEVVVRVVVDVVGVLLVGDGVDVVLLVGEEGLDDVVGRGTLVVGRRVPVSRSPGDTRSEGRSAIVRGAVNTPGFADGPAVLPAPPSPPEPPSASAPPRDSAATTSAPTAATERRLRPRGAGERSSATGVIGWVVSVRAPGSATG